MKKRIGIICTAAIIGLCGCNSKDANEEETTKAVDAVKCQNIMSVVLEEGDGINTNEVLYYESSDYEEYFEYLYDTSPDRVTDGAYAYASSAVADEVTIVYASEEDDVEVIKKHLEDRVDRRKQDFNGYKPEEVEKLENSVIDTNGRYVFMVVSENPDDIIDIINEEIEREE